MVRGGICPPVKNGNAEGSKNADIDYQMMARWRCKMQYQWMNGALGLCRNNASVSYFQNMLLAFGVSPQTSAGAPFLDPL